MNVCLSVCMYLCGGACMCVWVSLCVNVWMYVYVHVCVFNLRDWPRQYQQFSYYSCQYNHFASLNADRQICLVGPRVHGRWSPRCWNYALEAYAMVHTLHDTKEADSSYSIQPFLWESEDKPEIYALDNTVRWKEWTDRLIDPSRSGTKLR